MSIIANTQISEQIELDPITFWRLNDIPRFPRTPEDWDIVLDLPMRPRPKVAGNHDFDLVLNRRARRPMTSVMRKLLAKFRGDFEAANNALTPVQWRVLFYLDQYPASALSNPSFDALQTLRDLCNQDSFHTDFPKEWAGTSVSIDAELLDINVTAHEIDADVGKAAYAILSFARSLGLEKNEVLQVPWWRVWWIDRYLDATCKL